MYKFSVNKVAKALVLSSVFLLLGNINSAFADTHVFKYTPNDTGNTTSTVSNATTATDPNGVAYWSKPSGTSFIQSPSAYVTNSYIYIFIEGNASYLYNQFYVNGGTGHTNLSYFSSSGHDPDKVATFTVDGHTVSMYRLYTESGITTTNGLTIVTASNASSPYRIYGVVPTNATPAVTDQATMYSYLSTFTDTTTRIIDFTPAEGAIVASSSPVAFTLNYYINPADVGSIASVRVTFHNIDQNLLLSFLSDQDITFISTIATTSGAFSYASSTTLRAGNYRIQASLDRSLLYGLLRNPFSDINTVQNHQFVVGTSTFIGNLSQNAFSDSQAIFNSFSATSTSASAGTCNVLSGFDTMHCIAFLFIPSGEQMSDALTSFRSGIFSKFPLGYLNRVVTILSSTATSSLPSLDVHVRLGENTYQEITLDPNDMLTGGGAIVNSVTSPYEGKTIRQATEPTVRGLVSVLVIMVIIFDILNLAGSMRKNQHLT